MRELTMADEATAPHTNTAYVVLKHEVKSFEALLNEDHAEDVLEVGDTIYREHLPGKRLVRFDWIQVGQHR